MLCARLCSLGLIIAFCFAQEARRNTGTRLIVFLAMADLMGEMPLIGSMPVLGIRPVPDWDGAWCAVQAWCAVWRGMARAAPRQR